MAIAALALPTVMPFIGDALKGLTGGGKQAGEQEGEQGLAGELLGALAKAVSNPLGFLAKGLSKA